VQIPNAAQWVENIQEQTQLLENNITSFWNMTGVPRCAENSSLTFFYFCGLNKQTATYLFTLIFNIITLINMTSFQKLLNFI